VVVYIDFDVGRERLDGESEASDETSSTDWNEHSVDVGHLIHDLQTTRALPGQNVRMIVTAANSHQDN